MEVCIICKESQPSQMNVVQEKGFNKLVEISVIKEEEELLTELKRLKEEGSNIFVHHDCRRQFTDLRKKPKEDSEPQTKRMRSSTDFSPFDWKTCCFLCGKAAKSKKGEQLHQVSTIPIHQILIERAKERDDDWGREVLHRLQSCIDLVAAEAIYHSDCSTKFRLKTSDNKPKGRPRNVEMTESFDKVCDWLERFGDTEVYSVNELHEKMAKESDNYYSVKTFRGNLKEMYGDHVYFVQISGCRGELVCLKKMSDYILRKFKEDGHESKEDVIRVAAKLIKEDIREAKYMKEFYPTIESILNTEKTSLVPNSLQILMKYLISSDLKRESISQCIVQAAKPRSSIMPIPFGVGVEVDKTMGSEWLITHLHRL